MTIDNRPIPDLTLERYRLGELEAGEAAAITRLAAADPRVAARLDALAASDDEIHARYGDDALVDAVTRRLSPDRRERGLRGGRAWSLAGAAAVVLLAASLLPALRGRTGPEPLTAPGGSGSEANRVKGEIATLLLYRNAAAGSERLRDGDAARTGDLLRVAYRASVPRFGLIVSIDGRGVVTRHLPVTGDTAVRLEPGEDTPLAKAYELDDAPKWERFVLITSANEFALEPVLAAARGAAAAGVDATASLPLPAGFEQTSFLLRKVSRER